MSTAGRADGLTASWLARRNGCEDSLGDATVTDDDYREIYAEMRDWMQKVKDSTAYMSDIITAI